jgi:isoamylase
LIKLRQSYPALHRSRFLTGQHDEALDVKDVTWINANGNASMKCFGMLLDGRAQKTGIKRRGQDKTVLMVMNGYEGLVDFTFPTSEGGEAWSLLVDTNNPYTNGEDVFKFGSMYQVTGRSLLMFAVSPA